MKKVYYLFLGVLILGSTVMTSCSKDDDPKLSKSELIAGTSANGKKWQMTASTATNGSLTVDLYKSFDACDKDDLMIFYSNKTIKLNEGPTTCDPADSPNSDYDTGLWSLNTAETEITLDGDINKIKELSSSKMVVEYTDNGTVYSTTFTAK